MTATLSIADIVGADREAEARALVEQFADIAEEDDDPILACIIRRHMLSGHSYATIATDTGWDADEIAARFLAWGKAVMGAISLCQEDRRTPRVSPIS